MNKKTTGLVLGKFMPLHKGHELLINFAQNFVEELYILVDNINNAEIDGELRFKWVKNTFLNAKVIYIPKPMPQFLHENCDFWDIWKNTIFSLLPKKPDFLFASESYGFELSKVINSQFIPFDFNREAVNISASKIRKSPLKYWDYLSGESKKFFVKRICIFGPESTGKTMLSKALSQHFNTIFVPEYARLFIEAKKGLCPDDMIHIANGQNTLEGELSKLANKILICDTNAMSTVIWNKWLFNSNNPLINSLAKQNDYHLFLLMFPDLNWEKDNVRYLPKKSMAFFKDCKNYLDENNLPYIVIKGKGEKRLNSAINAISSVLKTDSKGSLLAVLCGLFYCL